MRAVTDIVLTQALDDAAEWQGMGIGVPIAVNLFAPSLGDLARPAIRSDRSGWSWRV
jgi:hypothetical protein